MDDVLAIQNDPKLQGPAQEPQRKRLIKAVIADSFDFREMGRLSLASEWAKLSPVQQEEFVCLLGDLFQESYTKLVINFLKKERISYDAEAVDGGAALVKTRMVRMNESIPIDYRLRQEANRWALFDVVIDGVSIAENYRTSFTKVIVRSSYENLVQRMRLKQEEGGSSSATDRCAKAGA